MGSARIVAVMLDGTKHEAVGVFMALADRVAFERQYDVSVLEMRRQTEMLDPDGKPKADVTALREERTAFFCWRTLHRGEQPVGDFEGFLDGVEEVQIERLEGPADPTDAGLPPGT